MIRTVFRKHPRVIIAIGVVVVLGLAGVVTLSVRGDVPLWGTPDKAEETDEAAEANSVSEVEPSGPPLPTAGARKLGEKIAVADLEVTVFSYKQPSTSTKAPAQAGYTWAALEAEVCVRSGTLAATWEPWSLVYTDGDSVVADSTASAGSPAFPNDKKQIATGSCARGWITFAVPSSLRPTMIEFQPRNDVANWIVPTK